MQRKTSIGSRIVSSVAAGLMLVAPCIIVFKVLPTFRGIYTQMQMPLPGFTRLVFAVGPAVLISMGLLAASLMVIGEFKPAVRRIREPFGIFVLILTLSALAAMFMPRHTDGEIINPDAAAPVHTAAPQKVP